MDRVYGEQAWLEKDGFTSAQGIINMTEVTLYAVYFWIVMTRGAKSAATRGKRAVSGKAGGLAVTLGLVAGSVTATKTALYCKLTAIARSVVSYMRPSWFKEGGVNQR